MEQIKGKAFDYKGFIGDAIEDIFLNLRCWYIVYIG